jgi:putative ABC transport system permease protein
MLKSIITQLWNRRRSNTSILVELTLVFCLVWYITDYFFVLACNYSIPNHRDIRHTWMLNMAMFPENHPDYRAEDNEPEALAAHFDRILQTLHNYPGVEAVTVSDRMSIPESGNYWGGGFHPEGDTSRVVSGQRISSWPQEDFFRVFGYTRGGGREAVSMGDFDWGNPQTIVISRSVAEALFPGEEATGKALRRKLSNGSEETVYVVGGVVDDIKRFGYSRPHHAYYLPLRPEKAESYRNAVISIRSSASLPNAIFRERFLEEMSGSLRAGNFYLQSIASYDKIRDDTARMFGMTGEVRTRAGLTVFFLLNILLCVTGTFRYRANQRRSEAGLRKAMGATNADISRSFLAEGLCLLAAAALAAMLIELQFVQAGLIETMGYRDDMPGYLPDRTALRFLITNALTACLLAAVILPAVWLSARSASMLSPAEALQEE